MNKKHMKAKYLNSLKSAFKATTEELRASYLQNKSMEEIQVARKEFDLVVNEVESAIRENSLIDKEVTASINGDSIISIALDTLRKGHKEEAIELFASITELPSSDISLELSTVPTIHSRCENCGAILPVTANFCPNCGVKVTEGNKFSKVISALNEGSFDRAKILINALEYLTKE